MTIGTLKSPKPRNRNSISVIKLKFLSASSLNTLLAFESHWRETWRHTGRRTVPQISLETPFPHWGSQKSIKRGSSSQKSNPLPFCQRRSEQYPMMHLVSCYIITAYVTYHDHYSSARAEWTSWCSMCMVSKHVSVQQLLLLRILS